MTERYSNNEIHLMIKSLTKKVDEGFAGIHARQDKTNGNIHENRCEIDKLKVWRGYITGGVAILTFVVATFLLPILLKFI